MCGAAQVLLFSLAPMFISTTEMGCIKMLEMGLIPLYGYFYSNEVPAAHTVSPLPPSFSLG